MDNKPSPDKEGSNISYDLSLYKNAAKVAYDYAKEKASSQSNDTEETQQSKKDSKSALDNNSQEKENEDF